MSLDLDDKIEIKKFKFNENYILLWKYFDKFSLQFSNEWNDKVYNSIKNILDETPSLVNAQKGGYNRYNKIFSENKFVTNGWNSKCDSKTSILHDATSYGFTKLVKLLLSLGANINILDDERYTPFNIAIYNHNLIIAYLLYKHGCDTNGFGCQNKNTHLMTLLRLPRCRYLDNKKNQMINTMCYIVLMNESERQYINNRCTHNHTDTALSCAKDLSRDYDIKNQGIITLIETIKKSIDQGKDISNDVLSVMKSTVSLLEHCFEDELNI